MKSFKSYILTEARQFVYTIPNTPRQKMIDFYTLSNLNNLSLPLEGEAGRREPKPKLETDDESVVARDVNPLTFSERFENVEKQRVEMLEKLCDSLLIELKDDLFWSICCEYVHVFDYNDISKLSQLFDTNIEHQIQYRESGPIDLDEESTNNDEESEESEIDKNKDLTTYLPPYFNTPAFKKFFLYTKQVFNPNSSIKKIKTKPKNFLSTYKNGKYKIEEDKHYYDRVAKITRALEALKISEKQFIEFAKWLYLNIQLSRSFGGIAWARICNAWLILNNSKNQELVFKINAIDGAYHAQHNTGSAFNKLEKYYHHGYEWIKELLDLKSYSEDYYNDIIKVSSPILQDFSKYYIKNFIGISLEDKFNEILKIPEKAFSYLQKITKNFTDFKNFENYDKKTQIKIYSALLNNNENKITHNFINILYSNFKDLNKFPPVLQDFIIHKHKIYDVIICLITNSTKYTDYKSIDQCFNILKELPENIIRLLEEYPSYVQKDLITHIVRCLFKIPKSFEIIEKKFSKILENLTKHKSSTYDCIHDILFSTKDITTVPQILLNELFSIEDKDEHFIKNFFMYYAPISNYNFESIPKIFISYMKNNKDYLPISIIYSILGRYLYDNYNKKNIPDYFISPFEDPKNAEYTDLLLDYLTNSYKEKKDLIEEKYPQLIKVVLNSVYNTNQINIFFTGKPIKEPLKTNKQEPEMKVYANGTKKWYLNGQLHREDGPAIEEADGTKIWYLNGKVHREDGPAYESVDGAKEWFLNGQCHREDGPAIEDADGTKEWHLNGQWHREGGPAYEGADGTKVWYLNGQCHREDGPACEYADGTKAWYLNGKWHREDGPAIERADGTKEWYLNGVPLTEEQFNEEIKKTKKTKVSESFINNNIFYKLYKEII
jgi:hypothetical protein